MHLDHRLSEVAALVPRHAKVADVGTDHAYLAMALIESCGAAVVIATDKNEGPCAAARHTLLTAGLLERVPVRCGDGLAPLAAGEVDTICIAGMGGGLIASILAAGENVLAGVSLLVLQPMNDAAILRRWLYENGWRIVEERLAVEDGRLYEIMAAKPGTEETPEPWLLTLGPVLWKKRPPLFRCHAKAQMARLRRILHGMEQSIVARESEAYREAAAELLAMERHCGDGEEQISW
ncbi:MAG: tRNA (adenine(22)-N(1))-methyltransferase TrmK [Schwartzia sp.]|nr:tRNA (adenine(22)-N(1))-methyltransferase TrmK [Schwartzia sp. (in: firmicutes)]